MVWNGKVWEKDKTQMVPNLVREICREAAIEAQNIGSHGVAKNLCSARTVSAIERLAQSERALALKADVWDADPLRLNTPDGILDLKTGKLLKHDSAELCTKITAVSPNGDCPLWLEFLDKVFAGDRERISYVQRVLGYCLTGATNEHALFFLYGTGTNGKSVLSNTFNGILKDYAVTASTGAFAVKSNEQHSTELAMLQGARIALVQETEAGQKWAEARIKDVTGGTAITARFMRQDFFTFQPQFKLVIAGNYKPSLSNVDEAMKRRLHLIPFAITIPENERDLELEEKLKAEWPGILKWAVEGCMAWQNLKSLKPPASVRNATNDYLEEEDLTLKFLEEKYNKKDEGFVEQATLFAEWRKWCEESGEYAGNKKIFVRKVMAKGFEKWKHPKNRREGFKGLELKKLEIPFEEIPQNLAMGQEGIPF